MAEPRFSLCSLHIGVFLPSVVSQFSPVSLQHLLPASATSSLTFLPVSLPSSRNILPSGHTLIHIFARYGVCQTISSSSIFLSSFVVLSLDPTYVDIAGVMISLWIRRFEKDRYTELRRTGSHSMNNPDCVLCLLTRTSWRNHEWSNTSRTLQIWRMHLL